MALDTLQDLFLQEMNTIYDAEKRIAELLPGLADAASSSDLRRAFEEESEITRLQIQRLEEIYKRIGAQARNRESQGVIGLIREVRAIMQTPGDPAVKDAALIAITQRIEHYEVTCYASLRQYAHDLGYEDIIQMFDKTASEERDRDKSLAEIAEDGLFSGDYNNDGSS
ncbi:MAG: ferritin-like domain-containing protein [Chitinispirillaceae bacterium]